MVQINLIHVLIWNLSTHGKDMDFKVFKDTVENDGEIKAIVAWMDALTEFVNIYGAKGLAWVKVVEDGLVVQLRVSSKMQTLKHLKNLQVLNQVT